MLNGTGRGRANLPLLYIGVIIYEESSTEARKYFF